MTHVSKIKTAHGLVLGYQYQVEASTGDEDFVTKYDDWKTNDTVHDGKVRQTEEFWNRDVTIK